MMNRIKLFLSSLPLMLASCDAHFDFPDTSVHVGDIICTDGDILRYEDWRHSGKEAVAVVFHLNGDESVEGTGYGVYLHDLESVCFADTCGFRQNTSCSLMEEDGNLNTYRIMEADDCSSELADAVFDLWAYGQSAYIPSVAQMRILFQAKEHVNTSIARLWGDLLPDDADSCWYWTSTEVEGQSDMKAWLFSTGSGVIQETPKMQPHKARPVITINY